MGGRPGREGGREEKEEEEGRGLTLRVLSAAHHFSYHVEIVKTMLKRGRVPSYISFKAHSGFSTVEFGASRSC